MKEILLFLLSILFSTICVGQTDVEKFLIKQGFENVKHISYGGKEFFCLESRAFSTYQRMVAAICESMDSISPRLENSQIDVILLRNKVPFSHFQGNRTLSDSNGKLIWRSDFFVKENFKVLRNSGTKERFFNSSGGKVDLLFYPQFRFKNTTLDRMYLFQININPTLEIGLWKGSQFTAQLIIPIYNDYSIEESRARPGFITLSQDFKVPGNIQARLTVGNFNQFRAGADLKVFKPIGSKMGLYGQLGVTAWSVAGFKEWYYTDFNKTTWRAGMNYFIRPWNLMFNFNVGKYLAKDFSARGEIIRYFKNASVGFYMQTIEIKDFPINGGFFFSVALPPYIHKRAGGFRISSAKYFNFEYLARPYQNEGRFYQTAPDESSTENFFNPMRINQIITNNK